MDLEKQIAKEEIEKQLKAHPEFFAQLIKEKEKREKTKILDQIKDQLEKNPELWDEVFSKNDNHPDNIGSIFKEVLFSTLKKLSKENYSGFFNIMRDGYLSHDDIDALGIFGEMVKKDKSLQYLSKFKIRQELKRVGLYDPNKLFHCVTTQKNYRGICIPFDVIESIVQDPNIALKK